ncbi:hypothetical protein BD410DRAFT_564258 [Rickenella mellea]|uniref:BZIP domain-containing protein n=1 Tax=Rickenella mellea TaxID=50990 RepID=A0A4Y7QEK5_9AGAM|nr:hypothetical protein BD410DRAFT_564258 [Rickenella mellea]
MLGVSSLSCSRPPLSPLRFFVHLVGFNSIFTMTPSSLRGLNIVHPPQTTPYGSDTQDLLSAPSFPDLAAQLELWTNLAFESDEPFVKEPSKGGEKSSGADEEQDEEDAEGEGTASPESHANVVNPTSITTIPPAQQQPFDLGAILAGFGIDPFLVPPVNAPQPSQAASLAQLLSSYPSLPLSYALPPQQPLATIAQKSDGASTKRTRTRKSSTASTVSRDTTVPPNFMDDKSDISTPLNATEDKRRRNTAASARFRLKKKEREAALEQKSKELEVRVNELERECEALRRENGWLKGLVVGVTGASAGAAPQAATSGVKRRRDDSEDDSRGNKMFHLPCVSLGHREYFASAVEAIVILFLL